jgi:serine/threonine protein kinase
MIDPDGTATIIDFGSVEVAGVNEVAPHAAKAASFAGTVQYTAPEIFLDERATPTSDLFSLGVIAYELLTGALPYGTAVAGAATQTAQRRLRYRSACELNPDVPAWVDAALAKAVSINPTSRYLELSEFVYDLRHPNRRLSNIAPRPLIELGTKYHWRLAAIGLALALALSILRWPEIGLVAP